ncbi:MAG: hypothetical protein IPK10_14285 [Bacteroidetes bacterium]|nr:hypothetical protein [Bacteroidota bacterium]
MGTLLLPISFLILFFGKGMMLWAIVYTVVITFSEILAMPFMMNFALSRPHAERQGQYSALYSISFGISNIAAPLIGLGLANKFGFDKMFVFLIFMSLLTFMGFSFLGKDELKKAQ